MVLNNTLRDLPLHAGQLRGIQSFKEYDKYDYKHTHTHTHTQMVNVLLDLTVSASPHTASLLLDFFHITY